MYIFQASLNLPVLKRYYEIFNEPLNVLLSIALIGPDFKGFLIDCRHMVNKIVADSGAWSVAKGNSNLTIERLISYLKLWGDKFDFYFNFDPDFSYQGFKNNYGNQLKMERAGLKPVPVIHNFYNNEINFYTNSGKYPWIALGSSQTTNFSDLKYGVDQIKWINPDIKVHWFGGSKFEWLVNLPIASCDTSSWAKAGGFGNIYYWNAHKEGLNKTDRIYVGGYMNDEDDGTYHFVTYKWRDEVEKYLRETFGFEYGDLLGYEDKFNMQLINTRFYTELERRVNEERIKRGIPLE
jgi:hypothetical protein